MRSKWLVILLLISIIPVTVNASFLSTISSIISGNSSVSTDTAPADDLNSQNLPLLHSSTNFNSTAAVGGEDPLVVDDGEALISNSGPSGTLADVSDSASTGQISKYMVRKGDTLSTIAKMFGVSVNTIIWANNVTPSTIKEGDILVILPVSGMIHTIAKGDTLQSIAKKYKADATEIAQFNGLADNSSLNVGDTIIIPNGEGEISSNIPSVSGRRNPIYNPYRGGSGPDYVGYYMRPLVGGVKTQGLHGYNAIDIGTPVGTPLLAAASGEVIIARSSGWNGGYGKYVVISHSNGTQTLYGHMSSVYVNPGEDVVQGQVIGLSGNTGDVSPAPTPSHPNAGAHLHFEVRGAYNFMANASEY